MVKVYTTTLIDAALGSAARASDFAELFKARVEAQRLLGVTKFSASNPVFGKDEPLTQPPGIRDHELSKLHLRPSKPAELKKWNRDLRNGIPPRSDRVLIYCPSRDGNSFLLIALLDPAGHEGMQKHAELQRFADVYAVPFRAEF